jgi:two-component system, chemotaxis family, CheB/CheR fusion protein
MTEPETNSIPSHVVGIGASAGGLEALEGFFDHLPKSTGMAFVIVQHLSPDFKSLMDELLARHTSLPIHLVENGVRVEPGHVYLIPPKKEMIIAGGRLLLSERDRQQELTLPIDVFFRSLAQDCGQRAIAIVLSGGGSDGSRGIRHVAELGGLVIVQDSESAQFDGMPRSARDSGAAHWTLAPHDMPAALLEHARNAATRGAMVPMPEGGAQGTGLDVVYRMLLEEFGIDFTDYKPSTVTRRIERRLALARSNDIDEYVQRLRSERHELDVLYQDLLIGVTRFFRDDDAFGVLERQILPELLAREPRSAPLRLWVAGCATGEEPYSLAIVLSDLMAKRGERPVKIFATDVHPRSLEHAARATYDQSAVANVDDERLARYFIRSGDSYQVVPELRQMIVFAQHNVIKDAPFTRVDLISCRNLLIYLQPGAQQKVLSLFHFALNRDGVLLLGPSESAGPLSRAFHTIDKHWRIYRKFTDARTSVDARLMPGPRGGVARPAGVLAGAGTGRIPLSQLLGTYEALLSQVLPPSLLVSDRGELLHSFGGANEFLRMRDGRQELDVLALVDPELKLVLATALKRIQNEPSPIVYTEVRLGQGREAGAYRVSARRAATRSGDGAVLFSFERLSAEAVEPPAGPEESRIVDGGGEQLRALELELSHTKESLQAAIEELEASNEELQASNEELQASNEELQSTNEELQSVNEELYTVNAEYQRKIAELIELTNDMDNLLSSTEVGAIFLDRQLDIRKFTPQIAENFNLVPHDVGRSIQTFAHRLEYPQLIDDLNQVLQSGNAVERELRGVRGKSFFLRVLPYRVKGNVEGVVLTLIDVSGLKAAEDALFHERYLLNSLLRHVPDAIYFKDVNGRFIRTNAAMATRLGLSDPAEAVGKSVFELPAREFGPVLNQADETVLNSGNAQHYKLERRVAADGAEAWDLVTRLPLRDARDEVVGIVAILRDVTQQKQAEDKIQEAVRRRDQFLAMLSHELRNPLGAMVMATALLRGGGAVSGSRDKFLNILERQSQQMSRLLDDLLEASRVTQNKIELKKRVLDLNTVVRDASDAVRAQMEAREIEFSVELAPLPLCIEGDAARLQQIHVNLLTNAAKYTQRGGHVRLTTRAQDGHAVVCVRDNGAGIPRDMLDSVFELFVQSSRTLDRSAGGLGVGLTLVRSLVELHGGRVHASSDGEGKGAEFEVHLPLTEEAQRAEPARARLRMPPRRDRPRIVVVEDNPDGREMLCELLSTAGFECHSADTGPSALELIDAQEPDIAILDVGLPGMDGLELARRLRQNPKHARLWLIALTGYGQAGDRTVALAAGFDEHLVKPVRSDDLLGLLLDAHPSQDTSVSAE